MKNFKYLFIFLISFLSAGAVWVIISFFLPKIPIVYIPPKFNSEFYNINITGIFTSENQASGQTQKTGTESACTLEGIKLKAIYNDGKKAFIILDDKGKNVFLDINQKYKGYRLVKVYNTYAVLNKNSKKYILSFETQNRKTVPEFSSSGNFSNIKTVSKNTIETYKKNFSRIWNEIGIIRVKNGYKITYVKKGSIFDKLGLKRGDIIIKVNGVKLTNDAQAWYLYNHIENYGTLEIEIKRNNKTKVIDYEID